MQFKLNMINYSVLKRLFVIDVVIVCVVVRVRVCGFGWQSVSLQSINS